MYTLIIAHYVPLSIYQLHINKTYRILLRRTIWYNRIVKAIGEYKQQKDGWCGPASLQYALAEQGLEVDQADIAKETHTTISSGVDPKPLQEVAQKHGMSTYIIEGKPLEQTWNILKEYKKEGWSIIIDYLAGNSKDDGHYVVVNEIKDHMMYVFDPSNNGSIKTISKDYLKDHWADYKMNDQIIKRFALFIHA